MLLLLSRFSHVQLCGPHRRQPIRLPRPWDSPGKNTGVACHFLLQCMKVKSESEVAQSYRTLSDPMDCSLPGSSVRGIFQARVLEWGAIAFSKCQIMRSYITFELNILLKFINDLNQFQIIYIALRESININSGDGRLKREGIYVYL